MIKSGWYVLVRILSKVRNSGTIIHYYDNIEKIDDFDYEVTPRNALQRAVNNLLM